MFMNTLCHIVVMCKLLGWMLDFGTGEVDSAHGQSLAWKSLLMGGFDHGPLGSKG